jgi:transposase InsO family protein
MIDADVAYLSESAVYRILDEAQLLCRWARPRRSPAQGPERATRPHQRWHTDIMHLRLADTWYFLVSFIDAYSRYLVHWRLLTHMTAEEVALVQLEALEKFPEAAPEIVSDHGCQYTSREYRRLLERFELKHILCRVAHPQSNGIIERYHRSTREALHESPPRNYLQAKDTIAEWIEEYNEHRLHAGLHYIEPAEYFRGDPEARREERKEKLARGRAHRRATNLAEEKPERAKERTDLLPTAGGRPPTSMVTHSRQAATCG